MLFFTFCVEQKYIASNEEFQFDKSHTQDNVKCDILHEES